MLRVLLLISPLLLASRLSSQQAPLNPASCPCVLRGAVVDSVTGNPIHGAFVQASTGSAWSVLTDSEGKFQMDALPAGPIILTVAKPGYLSNDELGSSTPKTFSFQLGPDTAPATLKLTPEGVIFGQVTDENGEPLEGFFVTLIRRNPWDQRFYTDNRLRTATDDEGKFRIPGLSLGFFYVAAGATEGPALTSMKGPAAPQGFAPLIYPSAPDLDAATPIKVLPGRPSQVNLSLKREPFIQLTGSVSGYSAEQQVVLNLQDSLGTEISQGIAVDSLSGSFHTNWIPPGAYSLYAQALVQVSGGESRPASFSRQSVNAHSSLSGIHLVLQPTVNIPVLIRGFSSDDPQQDQPRRLMLFLLAEGHTLRERSHYAVPLDPASGPPAGSSSMVITDVEPGAFEVKAAVFSGAGYYLESITWGSTDLLHDPLVLGPSSAVPPIDVVVREGAATLDGTVFSEGQPASGVVLVFSPSLHMRPHFATVGADGAFSVHSLAPGTYRVVALDGIGGLDLKNQDFLRVISAKSREITLAPRQTASLRLELTTVGE